MKLTAKNVENCLKEGSIIRNKGFTIIELMIVITILAILLAIAAPFFIKGKDGKTLADQLEEYDKNAISTPAGKLYLSCVSGYQFVTGSDGRLIQVLNDQGNGVPCN